VIGLAELRREQGGRPRFVLTAMDFVVELLLGSLAVLGCLLLGWVAAVLFDVLSAIFGELYFARGKEVENFAPIPRWYRKVQLVAPILVAPLPLPLTLWIYPPARLPFAALLVVLLAVAAFTTLRRRRLSLPSAGGPATAVSDLDILCGGSEAAWELSGATLSGRTVRLVFCKASEDHKEFEGAVYLPDGISAGFSFKIEDHEGRRCIKCRGAAFCTQGSVGVLPYQLEGDRLWIDSGNVLGLYEMKGEWKRATG
jgi:hypothetical protein